MSNIPYYVSIYFFMWYHKPYVWFWWVCAAHKPNTKENFKVLLNGVYKVKIDTDIEYGGDPDDQTLKEEEKRAEQVEKA